tara:strand:+ start:1127 stop:1303 length:177 start_codon:yes stop_codon:yes gene_type:complete
MGDLNVSGSSETTRKRSFRYRIAKSSLSENQAVLNGYGDCEELLRHRMTGERVDDGPP